LPLAAGKLNALVEPFAQGLVVFAGKFLHHRIGKALGCRRADQLHIFFFADVAGGNVLRNLSFETAGNPER
jgi:hypothetical protein